MRFNIIIFNITIIFTLIGCSSKVTKEEEISKEIKATTLLNTLSSSIEPGIQYIILNQHKTIFEKTVGLSDIKQNISLKSQHTMSVFSMTKVLTAIAILQLIEKEKINLDDKITKYLNHPYNQNITIRHLLNHTSGIPNPIPLKWVHLVKNHNNFREKQELDKVLKDNSHVDFEAGSKYGYSNIGYWLLGKIIEKVSKEEYATYVTNNIFKPLNLTSNEIGFEIENESNHAKGYLKKWSFMNLLGRFFIDNNVLGNYENSWLHIKNVYMNGISYGGAIGTAKAFGTLLQDLLQDKSKLLNNQTKQLLYQEQNIEKKEKIMMTLGWHIKYINDIQYFYKEGGGAGFHCEMRIYPKLKLASVLITNKTSFDTNKHLSNLDKIFF
jgi:CubicO group peptidase (beta-lactamase class C family)